MIKGDALRADEDLRDLLAGKEAFRAVKSVVDSRRPRLVAQDKIPLGASLEEDLESVLALLKSEEEPCLLWIKLQDEANTIANIQDTDWVVLTWLPKGVSETKRTTFQASAAELVEVVGLGRVKQMCVSEQLTTEAFLRRAGEMPRASRAKIRVSSLAQPTTIVDPHTQFTDPENLSWQSFLKSLGAKPFLPDTYEKESKGLPISKSIHIEAMPDDGYAEAKFVSDLVDQGQTHVVGIVASCDLSKPNAAEELDKLISLPLVKGIRYIINYDTGPFDGINPTHVNTTRHKDGQGIDFLRDPEYAPLFEQGFALLEERKLSFDLMCAPAQLPAAAAMFARYPKIPVCLNHLGSAHQLKADDSEEDRAKLAQWKDNMELLAKLPQVFVKISHLGCCVPGWNASPDKEALVRSMVREVIDLFGARRCMYASNWNAIPNSGSAKERTPSMVENYARLAAWASDFGLLPDEKERLFAGTATEFYQL